MHPRFAGSISPAPSALLFAGIFMAVGLVLKNGKRLNVVDHGKRSLLVRDARKLASFLNVPVWDATSG